MITAERFWEFSVTVYGTENMKEICLAWQDNHGLNVNLLLLCLWLDANGYLLADDDYKKLSAALEDTDSELQQLRQQRAGHLRDSTLYQQTLKAELRAEARQQAHLLRCLATMSPQYLPRNRPLKSTIRSCIEYYNVPDNTRHSADFYSILKKNSYFFNWVEGH